MASLSDSRLEDHLSGVPPEASVPPSKKQKLTSEPRLEDHLSGVPPEALDRPCIDDHLMELALRITGWKEIALFLKLDEGEIEAVEAAAKPEEVRARSLKMLRKWRNKFGENATYRCLVNTLWDLRRADVIDQICRLLQAWSASSMPQDSSTSTQPQLGPTPDPKSVLQVYISLLKSRYQSNMPGCTVQFPRPPTRKYFDLGVIKREEMEKGSASQELVRLTVEGRVREILEKRTTVELKDLFKLDQRRKKVILIEGPPGSGKTTLAWHVCQEWESGKLFSEFELVVYVQLRDPKVQAARSIADLLPRRDDEMARGVLTELKAKDGEGVLFVLDGWDELPGGVLRDSPLRQLIEPALVCPLGHSAVIVTSRPEASTKLHDLASSRVQIVGFTPEKVEDYFTQSLKGDSQATKALMERVKENPTIEGSCYIPLNAAIIVTLFMAMGHQLPPSLTGVFLSLVAYCILRHCKGRANIEIRSLSSLDKLPPALQTSFDSLCALAFQGILVNQITFSEEECEIYPEFATLSLLQAVEGFLDLGLTRTYNFLHLSIQELLAARHISKLPPDTQIEIVHGLLDHPRFAGVFRFYAGFTRLHTPGIEGIIREMVQTFKQDTYGGTKHYLMRLLLECLHEVQDPTLYQMVAEEWGHGSLSLYRPSPVSCLSAGYLLPRLSYPHIGMATLDGQHIVLFAKGLSNGCSDHQQPRNGFGIDLSLDLCDHNGLQAIAQLLSSSFSVRHLGLESDGSSSGPPGVLRCIGEAMAANTSVRSLDLRAIDDYFYHPSGDSTGPVLCEMLKKNKTLKTLTFLSCYIGPHVTSIAEGLVHNTTLKNLVLYHCGVTGTGVKSLADMLVSNTTLETLEISMSGEGIDHLAEALKVNTTLRVLDLDESMGRNPERLAVALTVNTTLERLEIVCSAEYETEKLMSNGVLQQLLTIAIERTVSEFGGEETGRALMTILEEWRVQLRLREERKDCW